MRKIFYIILLFLGLSILLTVFLNIQKTKSFINSAEQVDGRVTSVKQNEGGIFIPQITFLTGRGDYITFDSNVVGNPTPFEQGEVVSVLYSPLEPTTAQVDDSVSLYKNTFVLTFLGSLFTFLGIHRFIYFMWYQKRLACAKKNYFTLEAVIEYKKNSPAWIQKIFLFRCFYGKISYARDQTFFYYKSPLLWRPLRELAEKQTIHIYVDQNNPKRYYMDIPNLHIFT